MVRWVVAFAGLAIPVALAIAGLLWQLYARAEAQTAHDAQTEARVSHLELQSEDRDDVLRTVAADVVIIKVAIGTIAGRQQAVESKTNAKKHQ